MLYSLLTISGTEEKTEATSSAPGAFPETPANEGEFSVNPIPASSGVGNPVNVPAGEGVPHPSEVTPHTVDSTVTTSKEDYEKAGGITAGLAAVGAGVAAAAASVFGKPESKENVIPESSLPMGAAAGAADTTDTGPTIQSAAAHSTTAGLAAGVPLEPKREATVVGEDTVPESVPAAVKESIAESHQSPEAAASSEAVKEKAAVEKELLGKVKSSEATGESAKAADSQGSYYGVASSVPKPVEESLVAAHASPEATTETAVVAEKSNVEQELLKKVPHSDAAGEPAPTLAAATSATAPSTTAAVTEGAVDPALADEPAVRMMNQHDADATTSTGATATATTTEAAATKSEATEAKSDPAAVKSEPAEASPQTTEAKTTTTDKDSTPAAAATTSAASTPAGTPAKDNKSSLPSTSTPDGTPTKDKKKKHRVSAFFKKIFD